MEALESNDKKDSDGALQEHVVNQKDIHDFWEHVVTESRISDVCTTFESESKQAIKKLYENTATVGEKFAVANFLLQVGALQFRIQKNPDNENDFQTIIILQKPDTAAKTSSSEGQGTCAPEASRVEPTSPSSPQNKPADGEDGGGPEGTINTDGDHNTDGNHDTDGNIDAEAIWNRSPVRDEEEKQEPPPPSSPPPSPPPPLSGQFECRNCHEVLPTPWDLDLHWVDKCDSRTAPTQGLPPTDKPDGSSEEVLPAQGDGNNASTGLAKRKRGRPRKNSSAPPTVDECDMAAASTEELPPGNKPDDFSAEILRAQGDSDTISTGLAKRKRGRPRKSAAAPPTVNDCDDETAYSEGLPRGDPPDGLSEECLPAQGDDDVASTGIAKRKRGRPRKYVAAPHTVDDCDTERTSIEGLKQGVSPDSHAEYLPAQNKSDAPSMAKRKRGRPRKYAPPPPSVGDSPGEALKKRGPGRPRKMDTLSEESVKMGDERGDTEKGGIRRASSVSLEGMMRGKRERRLPLRLRDVYKGDTIKGNVNVKSEGEIPSGLDQIKEEGESWIEGGECGSKETTKGMDGGVNVASTSDVHRREATDINVIENEDGTVQCDICLKTFKTFGTFAAHMANKHSQGVECRYECSTCGKKFGIKAAFRKHLIKHQNKAADYKLTCVQCNAVFIDKASLKAHKKTHPADVIMCDICGKTFSNVGTLTKHRATIHTRQVSYPCTLCDRVFYVKCRLRDHMVTHSGERKFPCDLCDKAFFMAFHLKTHKRVVHTDGNNYLCDTCGSKFKSKWTLKQHHLTAHTDIKDYPCRQCGKLFSRSSLRSQHERVHLGLNRFMCEHCGKGFRDQCKLKVHQNWHLGIRPHACHICGKTFLTKGNLTKHERIHTGERPYVCGECGHGCLDSSMLKRHLAQTHNIQTERVLTKGPARRDGELLSRPAPRGPRPRKGTTAQGKARAAVATAKKNTTPTPIPAAVVDAQAYTIATDALIEISQQLADMSNSVTLPTEAAQIVVGGAVDPQTLSTQAASSVPVPAGQVVDTVVSEAGPETSGFPVLINMADQSSGVTVPVTQSITDFQSLELITLSS